LGTVYQSKSKQKREKFSINSKGKGWILARGKTEKQVKNSKTDQTWVKFGKPKKLKGRYVREW